MIIGNLRNTDKYEHIHPLFKKAFEYLKTNDLLLASTGVCELQGKDMFAIISDSSLKDEEEAKLEVHDLYIDIQMPLSDPESFGWKHRGDLEMPLTSYDQNKDIQFFADRPDTIFSLSPVGNFVVFFPDDAHAPCIGTGNIRKVVLKIKV